MQGSLNNQSVRRFGAALYTRSRHPVLQRRSVLLSLVPFSMHIVRPHSSSTSGENNQTTQQTAIKKTSAKAALKAAAEAGGNTPSAAPTDGPRKTAPPSSEYMRDLPVINALGDTANELLGFMKPKDPANDKP